MGFSNLWRMNFPCSTAAVDCVVCVCGDWGSFACSDACANSGTASTAANPIALKLRMVFFAFRKLIRSLQNKHGEYPYCEPSSKVRNPAKSLFSRLILRQRRSKMAASKKGSHEQKCVVAGYD